MRLTLAPRLRRAAVALLAAGLLAPVAVATAPSASAACASRTTRSISGTVFGVDNKDVNVSIGFDIESTSGVAINLSDGCPKTGGYSAPVQELNHYVRYDGAPRGSQMYDHWGAPKGTTRRTWSLNNLPSNAKSVWIEVWARDYVNYNNPSAMGPVNTAKYGFVTRRQVPVGTTGVMLRLPMNCNFAGGSNAAIAGSVRTRAGVAVTPDHVYAWSLLTDQNYTVMGWGTGRVSSGSYKINALAANQSYVMRLIWQGRTYEKRGVAVSSCKTSGYNWVL